jgi:hypothetical protein
MKTINVQNPKKQKSKRYLLFSALILVVCGLMVFNAFSNNKNLNEESFDSTKGIVKTFEVKENEYLFNIQDLKDDKLSTTVILNVEIVSTLPKIKDNLKIDDKIELIYNLESKDIYKVTINNEILYDRLASAIKSNNQLIIFYLFVAAVMLTFMVLNLITYFKEPTNIDVDYIKYIICNSNAITNSMISPDSQTAKILNREKLINKVALIVVMVAIFGSIMLKSVINNKYILLAICLLLIGGLITVIIIFKPRLYSKNLNIFIEDYIDYLNNGKTKEERTIFLKKEGLKVINEDQTYFFDYHELNLYTVCIYSKSNAPVNIFICSQLPEKEEYKDIQDFIIPLSRDLYNDICENSIFIIGLEEVLNNFNEEAINSIKEVKETYLLKHYK